MDFRFISKTHYTVTHIKQRKLLKGRRTLEQGTDSRRRKIARLEAEETLLRHACRHERQRSESSRDHGGCVGCACFPRIESLHRQ